MRRRPLPRELAAAVDRLDAMDDLALSQAHGGAFGPKKRLQVISDIRLLIEALRTEPPSPFGDSAA